MNRNQLKKLIQGPIATVPTPFDARFNVDLGCMHELREYAIENISRSDAEAQR